MDSSAAASASGSDGQSEGGGSRGACGEQAAGTSLFLRPWPLPVVDCLNLLVNRRVDPNFRRCSGARQSVREAERRISRETAETFGVGYFSGKGSMSGRIVIPIHNEHGELVAYAGRTIDESAPRYKLPAGFHKGQAIQFASSGQKQQRNRGRGLF